MSHSLFGRNPRAAAHSPTRTSLQAEAKSEAMSLFGSMLDKRFPFRTQALHMLLCTWPIGRVTHLSMKELNTLNPRCRDGLKVASDALATDAAVEEMEPSLGIENAVRLEENLTVALRKRTM